MAPFPSCNLNGKPPSEIPTEILKLLQKSDMNHKDLIATLPYKEKSIRYHIEKLHKTGKIVAVVKGNMKSPYFRIRGPDVPDDRWQI